MPDQKNGVNFCAVTFRVKVYIRMLSLEKYIRKKVYKSYMATINLQRIVQLVVLENPNHFL